MGHYMKAEFFEEAAVAIEQIGAFTARRPDEVVSDALRTYLWLLHEQAVGRKVVSKNSESQDECPVVTLIQDKEVAQTYFAKLGW